MPTILRPRVQIPSTKSMFFQFILTKLILNLLFDCANNQKGFREWPILKSKGLFLVVDVVELLLFPIVVFLLLLFEIIQAATSFNQNQLEEEEK